MPVKWVKRKAHNRSLKSGHLAYVHANWASYDAGVNSNKSYRHRCPECGAKIVSVHMPNGGWAHFEGEKQLSSVKHPCLHRGETLSRSRDDSTLDLFEGRVGARQWRFS